MHSPGPKYLLPTTVGYDKHDITRFREPAYSLNPKLPNESKDIIPGPKYQCDKLTSRGLYQSKSAFLSSRFSNQDKLAKETPGSGKYFPNIKADSRYKKIPEVPHLGGFYKPPPDIKPGPKYMLASTLGRNGLEFPNSPCACLIGKSNYCSSIQVTNSPGPGKYFHTNMDIYLKKSPGVPLGMKRTDIKVTPATIQPGPKYYGNYNKIKCESPAYSLGVRHSWKQALLRLPIDGGHYYGPKYVLLPLVGFENHDPTKYREPAYSITGRHAKEQTNVLPGPKYMTCNVTRYGPFSNQSVIVIPRRSLSGKNGKSVGPGPNKYLVDKLPSTKSSPTWFFTSGRKKKITQLTPGPKYMIESTIANNVPFFPSSPKWPMGVRPSTSVGAAFKGSPGPARYGAQNLEYIKKRAPEAVLSGKTEINKNDIKPGPKYNPNNKIILKNPPSWVFGLKHSQKKALLRTPQDSTANINCVL